MFNFRKRIKYFLRAGLEPNKIALALALGFVIGIIPFYGIATLLCLVVALLLRLNLAVIQLANYGSLPVMLLTIVPFYRYGNQLFDHPIPSGPEIMALFNYDAWFAFGRISLIVFNAIAFWAILAPFLVIMLYTIFQQIIHKVQNRRCS